MPLPNNGERGKLGLAELCSIFSQGSAESVNNNYFCGENSNLNNDCFCYRGYLDDQSCLFKIDTGSDVSVLSRRLAKKIHRSIPVGINNLSYPTGEKVPVDFKVKARVVLGNVSIEIPVYVANIRDDCILGVDFLSRTGFGKVFATIFGEMISGE